MVTRRFSRRIFGAAVALMGTAPAFWHSLSTPEMATVANWQSGPSLPFPASEFSAAVIDESVYVAGGFGMESRMFRLDTRTDDWFDAGALPEPRHHAPIAALNGKLYLVGGHGTSHQATDTVFRYDPSSTTWEALPALPQGPRGALGVATLDGLLYAVGGSSGDLSGPATADCTSFDPATGTWSTREPIPTAREHLAVAAAGGMIVAIGGRNGSDVDPTMAGATEVFDPASDSWRAGAPLMVPRSGMGVASDGEGVIVLGGEGERGLYDEVDRYDPLSDSWASLPSLSSGRHGLAAAVADMRLYAIGGSIEAWTIANIADVEVLQLR